MSLLKKVDKAKSLKVASRGGSGGTVSALRPAQVEKLAPCMEECPAGNDVRGWLNTISQHTKTMQQYLTTWVGKPRSWKIGTVT